jgi:hypothetical protein
MNLFTDNWNIRRILIKNGTKQEIKRRNTEKGNKTIAAKALS